MMGSYANWLTLPPPSFPCQALSLNNLGPKLDLEKGGSKKCPKGDRKGFQFFSV